MTVGEPTDPVQRWLMEQTQSGHTLQKLTEHMIKDGWPKETALDAIAVFKASQNKTEQPSEPQAISRMPGPKLDNSPTSLFALDREVQVLMTVTNPKAVLFGGLLSDEECDEIIELARSRIERSSTMNMETGGNEINAARSSQGMFFTRGEHPVIQRVEARIAELVNWPIENGEGLQILRYSNGAEYKPHYDYFDPAKPGSAPTLKRNGQRIGTLVMYLSTPIKGGGTSFPDANLEVSAVKGNVLFFSYDRPHPDTKTLHGSVPVIEGEKWAAIKWLREKRFETT